jgi:putative DNA primase/helicase
MVGSAVENQKDVLPGKLAREHVKKSLEACRVRSRHDLYFRMLAHDQVGNRAGLLGKGSRIDIRGQGGYVIAPPSVRKDGVAYSWLDADVAIATSPLALIDLVLGGSGGPTRAEGEDDGVRKAPEASITDGNPAARKYGLSALDAELQILRNARTGGRNDALNVAALKLGQLMAAGALQEGLVRATLEQAAADCGLIEDDGLRAVRATINSGNSGLWSGLKQPRDLSEVRRKAAHGRRRIGFQLAAGGTSSRRADGINASPLSDHFAAAEKSAPGDPPDHISCRVRPLMGIAQVPKRE